MPIFDIEVHAASPQTEKVSQELTDREFVQWLELLLACQVIKRGVSISTLTCHQYHIAYIHRPRGIEYGGLKCYRGQITIDVLLSSVRYSMIHDRAHKIATTTEKLLCWPR